MIFPQSFEMHQLEALLARQQTGSVPYLEFIRQASLSMGLYVLKQGSEDLQQPHREDEVYYVLHGRARFRADDNDVAVAAGTVLFVRAGCEHRFYQIEEDLSLLVFFAPPETGGEEMAPAEEGV